MDKNVEQEVNASEKKKYAEEVKSTIINALAEGKSILQQDREGIDYSLNAASGTVYSAVNQAYLQQVRLNNGYKNPHFMTFQQIRDQKMFVKDGEKGSIINYYVDQARYQRDEYPINPATGKEDKSKPIIHSKGSVKIDPVTGKEFGENQYNFVFNLQQVDTNLYFYRVPANAPLDEKGKPIGSYVVASNAFVPNENVKLENPYVFKNKEGNLEYRAQPGMHYKAKDNTIIERFAEDISKYFNSCVTGAKFKKVDYSPEDIKTLQAEISNRESPFFMKINDASLIALGNQKKAEWIENRRSEIAQEKENKQSRGMTR